MTDAQVSDLHYQYSKQTMLLFVFFLLAYEISTYVANDMIMPGMLQVVNSFSASQAMIATSLTAFIYGGASLQLFLGPLSDRFGRRPVMLTGAVLFLLSNVFIVFAQSMQQFILARYFQGMGLCFISVIGYATLHEIFVENSAVRVISIMKSITILAPLSGPLLGAIVIHYYGWRMVFHLIAFTAVIALIGIWLFMPETVGQQRLDGTINERSSLRLSVIKNHYINLFTNKRFIIGAIATGFLSAPMIAWIGMAPIILIDAAHLSIMDYGLWQIPVFIFGIFGNVLVRRHLKTLPLTRITEIGSIFIFLSLLFLLLITFVMHNSYIAIIIGITIYSFWLGYISAPLNRLTLFATMVPKGTASALASVILMLITGSGNQLAGFIYSGHNNLFFSLYCAILGVIYYFLFTFMKSSS